MSTSIAYTNTQSFSIKVQSLAYSMGAGKSSSKFMVSSDPIQCEDAFFFTLPRHCGQQNTLSGTTRPITTCLHKVTIKGFGIGWSCTTYSIAMRGLGIIWLTTIYFYQTQLPQNIHCLPKLMHNSVQNNSCTSFTTRYDKVQQLTEQHS